MGDVALEQRERGHHVADEEAAAIAQEDARPGWKLKNRKPSRLPMKASEHQADEELAERPRVDQEHRGRPRSATPADRPSMLSSRLKALVMPDQPQQRHHDVQPLVGQERRAHAGGDQDDRGRDLAQPPWPRPGTGFPGRRRQARRRTRASPPAIKPEQLCLARGTPPRSSVEARCPVACAPAAELEQRGQRERVAGEHHAGEGHEDGDARPGAAWARRGSCAARGVDDPPAAAASAGRAARAPPVTRRRTHAARRRRTRM